MTTGPAKNRIGVLGGTFDPPHFGHLAAAEAAIEEFGLGMVLFVPSGHPPHKNLAEAAAAEHRFAMTVKAVAGNPRFDVSRVELGRPGPHYTVDTMRLLHNQYKGAELFFIVGGDMILDLPNWRQPEEILTDNQVIAVARPGYDLGKIEEKLEPLFPDYPSRVHVLQALGVAVSSTEVRERLASGLSARYLVPDPVLTYIEENRLYRPTDQEAPLPTLEEILPWLRQRLSPQRYEHTLRVVEVAQELADRHGVSRRLAEVAAALHDCARDLSVKQQLDLVGSGQAAPDEPALLHASAGANLAKQAWNIHNTTVLNAICYHTTGRAGMSTLEKVVFIADYVEPGRSFAGVEEVRQRANHDLDAAMAQALDQSIKYILAKPAVLDFRTVQARNFLLKTKIKTGPGSCKGK